MLHCFALKFLMFPQQWSLFDMHNPEELQYKLMCASMELQNAKAAAKAEEKIQEAKLSHLQELLRVIKKERDEALEECRKLQVCLSRQSTSSADSPCSFVPSSSMVSSPSSSPWSLHELEEHLNNDNFCDFPKAPAPMELQQTLQSFSQSCNEGLQALFSIEPTCESVPDSEQQFSLEVLEQDLSFDADPSLNLAELEQDDEGLKSMCESTQSTRSLSRQSSSNSSSTSVQMLQGIQSSRDLTEVSAPILPPVTVMSTDVVADVFVPPMVNNVPFPVASSDDKNAISVMEKLPLNSHSPPQLKPIVQVPVGAEGSSCMKTTPSTMQAFAGSPMASPTAKLHANSTHVRQVHLPEPPEADPQVMLSSLPEKGKLLQAVMQAGPLLQTLLLAGPLPQWRHPPPALSTGDIPKVSMVPSNVILPYPSHLAGPLMQGHAKYHTPTSNVSYSSTTRVRMANADPCSRTKKLRKLSPASPHQSQLMHMMSGEGMIAVGVSYPPTIY